MKICEGCFHNCHLDEGQDGFCHARGCRNSEIVSLNYGRFTALALDPIEKKPLRRFHQGSRILSVGSFGCNIRCPFCQNYTISQTDESSSPETRFLSPEDLCQLAINLSQTSGNIGVAYTYNEPTVSWEYLTEASRLIHEAGLLNVLVTNGELSEQKLDLFLPYMDAMNIDLKGFSEDVYRRLGGYLESVLAFIRKSASVCHVELTSLIVPGYNDSEDDMEKECQWIASISPEIPLHITRYFPRYHEKAAATEISLIYRMCDIAGKYLKYVYPGNI